MTAPRLLAVIVLTAAAANAQPVSTEAASLPLTVELAPVRPGASAGSALLVSAGATAAGVAAGLAVYAVDGRGGLSDPAALVFLAGAALGPSAGNVWLGKSRDALIGTGLRVAGLTAMGLGAAAYDGYSAPRSADVALAGGAVLFLAGLGFDAVTQVGNGQTGRIRVAPADTGLALRVGL